MWTESKNEERIWLLTKAVNQAETRIANAQEDRAKLDLKKFQKSLEIIQAKIRTWIFKKFNLYSKLKP